MGFYFLNLDFVVTGIDGEGELGVFQPCLIEDFEAAMVAVAQAGVAPLGVLGDLFHIFEPQSGRLHVIF